jgi:UDP-glucose 4-epimerase
MNVLLIGGNGFIGSHIVDKLIAEGHKVRVFDFQCEKYRTPIPDVDYRLFSLDNSNELASAMEGIDGVFHLASLAFPGSSNFDLIKEVESNLFSTINILNLAVKLGVKKFVYFSSGGAVYGSTNGNSLSEKAVLNPISSYGIIKATSEMYISLYQTNYDIDALIIRPSNPFGPRQNYTKGQGVIPIFLNNIKNNIPLSIFGDGEGRKDYIYITDLVNSVYDLFIGNSKGVFNIGSGKENSINSIIKEIKSIIKKDFAFDHIDRKIHDVKNLSLDISKLKSQIEIENFVSFREGIKKTWAWIVNI